MGSLRFAVIVHSEDDRGLAQLYFEKLSSESTSIPPETDVVVYLGPEGLQQAVSEIDTLLGIAVDRRVAALPDESKAQNSIKIFELVKIPLLLLSLSHLRGGAIEHKILEKQWQGFEEELARYSPRGLRIHARKVVYLKVLAKLPPSLSSASSSKPPQQHAKSAERLIRSVTFDVSRGGCFVVLFEALEIDEEVFLAFDTCPEFVRCRVAWKLNWGSSEWHLPGVGLQFLEVPASAAKVLNKYLEQGS